MTVRDQGLLRSCLHPVVLARWLWSQRDLIDQLTRRDIAAQYRQSFLGLVWGFVQPLLTLAVYAFVFTVIFQPRFAGEGGSRYDYVLQLFSGLVIWGVFAETVGAAPMLVVSKPSYVKQIIFPLEVLPIATLGASLFSMVLGTGVLLLAVLLLLGSISSTLWMFPVVLVPLVLLTLGTAWLLASLGVYVRDTEPAVRVLVQLLFFATPVLWVPENLPEELRPWLALNPMASVIDGARATLVEGQAPPWASLGISSALGLVWSALGLIWFRATSRGFSDVL